MGPPLIVALILGACAAATPASHPLAPTGVVLPGAHSPSTRPTRSTVEEPGPKPWQASPGTDPSWLGWYRDEVSTLTGQNPEVVFIGDSITFAWATTGSASWASFSRYRPVNLGVPGDTSQNVLWRIDHGELSGLHPLVVVVMVGTNDLGKYPAAEVSQGVEAVVADLSRVVPSSRILLVGLLPIDPVGTIRHAEVTPVDETLAGVYRVGPVTYLDLRSSFAADDGQARTALYHRVCLTGTEFCDELVHPSAAGYAVMTDAVGPVLDRLVSTAG